MESAIVVGAWSLVSVIGLVVLTATVMGFRARRRRRAETIAEARSDARRWYELLGGQLSTLTAGGDEAAASALTDAAGCHELAARQLEAATTVDEYQYVRRTATEGLRHIGTARTRLGLVAGPQGPPPVDRDGRPMYEEAYHATPASAKARGGDDRYEQPRGGIAAPGVVSPG
ncbi:hypothetical protein [Stackebrandtia soli]|uniref:hypothetical protein n=1 Tax=Stackebrandtia soli TaxID=1892856 RepID=UPI0039EB4569